MIKSYHDKETNTIASGTYSKKLPSNIQRRAKMRLERINVAIALDDLVLPPSHMLKALKGKRKGKDNTVFVLINNTTFALSGKKVIPTK